MAPLIGPQVSKEFGLEANFYFIMFLMTNSNCLVNTECAADPDSSLPHATSDHQNSVVYVEGETLNVTCDTNYATSTGLKSQTLTCGAGTWETASLAECKRG